MSKRSSRRLAFVGLAVLLGGIASLIIGLFDLDLAVVQGVYFNRGNSRDIYYSSVDGKGWLIAGTALVAAGGVALAAATFKRE